MPDKDIMVQLDSRNRVCLTKVKNRAERYLITEEPDGTLILSPVEVISREDLPADVRAKLDEIDANPPQQYQEWVRRTPRASERDA